MAGLSWGSGILLELFDRECGEVPTYQYRCRECGKSFERTETITEHEAAKARCPKCNSKKVTQVPGRIHVVTSKKS
jgi:putative FmdB family regulatory protein